jgi:anthranilate phosphoribosyltransferase
MPRKTTKSATSGKSAQLQISAKLLEELIAGPVTKEQFELVLINEVCSLVLRGCVDSSRNQW